MATSSTPQPAGDSIPLTRVAEAAAVLRPVLLPTHLLRCLALDEVSGYRTWLKPESLQRTGSYKIRGAYYKLHQLQKHHGADKVIAASAGNHAQGVAYAARELGLDCVIVMPHGAPLPKRRATARYGAKLLLEGNSFDDSLSYALHYAPGEGREFISPYDDLDVITGQATVAWEILEEMMEEPPDAIIVPVGGGGLLAGVASVLKQALPSCKLIAVQSACAPGYVRSWERYKAGTSGELPLDVPTQETVADGVRVRQPGHFCWQITRDVVSEAVTVDDAQVYQGILFLAEEAKLVAEGAGALGVAALLNVSARQKLIDAGVRPGSRVVVLVTGGNIDSLTLHRVIGRSLSVTAREQSVALRIKDEPGQLGYILDLLRRNRATVQDLRRKPRPGSSGEAEIEILIETEDERHGEEVLQELARESKVHNFELRLNRNS
jgi:threonine dehydratase